MASMINCKIGGKAPIRVYPASNVRIASSIFPNRSILKRESGFKLIKLKLHLLLMNEKDKIEKKIKSQVKSSRRERRARRLNTSQIKNKELLDELPIKERWSREFRKPRIKKLKSPDLDFDELEIERGLVIEVHRRTCEVRLNDGGVIKARYNTTVIDALGFFPAVGDKVTVGFSDETYILLNVLPRHSALTRPGPKDRSNEELVLAANIDQVIIVASVQQPPFNYGFLDRFLLVSQLSHLPFVLVLNKIDLIDKLPQDVLDFIKIVDQHILVSCKTGEGIEDLKKLLKNKSSVFSGQSGVGKTSIINKLLPEVELKTGEVRLKDGKGRHTTTSSNLFSFEGGNIIDTPGIRSLGLMNMDSNDLAKIFPGFFKEGVFTCKFSNCLHLSEIDCSVLKGVQNGEISKERYDSYLRILNSKD